jgi:predicted nucleotidyltransferase component of viral defense system
MLQTQAVESGTLEILKQLMSMSELSDFLLVGGTALSLHYGHRISIDLDLFSSNDFENEIIARIVESRFPTFSYRSTINPIGLFGFIDNLKVDFVKHHHFPIIDNPEIVEGIRFMSKPDIIAMKVNAVMKRGVKKDFWDIAELLQHYSIADFIDFYKKKYSNQQLLISVPQALVYFDDAEESEEPRSLKGQTWESVKKFIQKKVSAFLL